MKLNLDKFSYAELHNLRSAIDGQLERRKGTEREATKKRIEALLAESGFKLSEVLDAKPYLKMQPKTKVAMFLNPDNREQQWTGRGRKPNWLVAKLAEGHKLEDFRI